MLVIYFALVLLCQIFLQGFLVASNVTESSFFAGLLVVLLAFVQIFVTLLTVIGFDVGGSGTPSSVFGGVIVMSFVTAFWSFLVGGILLVISSCIPHVLAVTTDH
ncbi:MAG: hypothetical protein K2X81_23730, partial [Candidatus Obscuribacterales bacterium]|nr:hypothetical protein [Candidatus Obscuribacterales bacterium]